jgi:hypothetical protein
MNNPLFKLLLLLSSLIKAWSRLQSRGLFLTNKTSPEIGYTGTGCGVRLGNAGVAMAVMKFFALGDTPYDGSVPPPFEGSEYQCLQSTILPGMMTRAYNADFIFHVGTFDTSESLNEGFICVSEAQRCFLPVKYEGDIKRGSSAYSMFCTDDVFQSRKNLFRMVEPTIDFFIVPGDNEWNECDNYNANPAIPDVVKTRWRQYFADSTSPFSKFDRAILPSGETVPNVSRQTGQNQNFFFYYSNKKIAFIGITEPLQEVNYDTFNADWISSNLSGRSLNAIVIVGQAATSSNVLAVLDNYTNIPTLYIKGNEHSYCLRFLNQSRFPKLLELTVDAFSSPPILISLVRASSGEYFFSTEKQSYGC